jgi:hypothetical protein
MAGSNAACKIISAYSNVAQELEKAQVPQQVIFAEAPPHPQRGLE